MPPKDIGTDSSLQIKSKHIHQEMISATKAELFNISYFAFDSVADESQFIEQIVKYGSTICV